MSALRGALIGCGFFSINHLHAWQDVDGADIVAICDRDPARLTLVGDQFAIGARYADAQEMLARETLDFVDIATTAPAHRPLVELAASHRHGVICQKPFSASLEEARAMVAACESAEVPLMIHENFRWQSAIRAVGRAIDSGVIGDPFWGRVSFRSAFDVFRGQPYLAESNRFIIEDLGIHSLDIARFLFGDVARMTARTRRVNPEINGEDVATMLLDHEGGLASIVDCSYATRLAVEPFPETLVEVDGSEGSLRLNQGYELLVAGKQGAVVKTFHPRCFPGRRALGTISRKACCGFSSIGSTACVRDVRRILPAEIISKRSLWWKPLIWPHRLAKPWRQTLCDPGKRRTAKMQASGSLLMASACSS